MNEPWRDLAACTGSDNTIFYPEEGGGDDWGGEAKAICAKCRARVACLDYAMTSREEFGIWGGHTATERRRIRRKLRQIQQL
jgi:WhiB family transcriptional regulator, redox-sensing transcriptional regulator